MLVVIREQGYREAGRCVEVGGANAAAPFVLGAVAVLLGVLRKRPASS